MSRRTNGVCRREARRCAAQIVRSPMSNFPYSTSIPSRRVLADMVVFYASPEIRDRIRMLWPEDSELLSDLVEQVVDLFETWEPSTDWHRIAVVQQGRTLEWLVWQTVTAADDEVGLMYRHDPIIPFAIDLETLPRYPLAPTLLVHPDDTD